MEKNKLFQSVRWKSLLTKKEALCTAGVFFAASIVSCDSIGGLDNEAISVGQKYYEEQVFLKCGDSWFARFSVSLGHRATGFVQVKNLDYSLEKFPVSEADKANGIEWRGRLYTRGKMFRSYNPEGATFLSPRGWGGWMDWDGWPNPGKLPVGIYRINGQWGLENVLRPNKIDFTCSQIPGVSSAPSSSVPSTVAPQMETLRSVEERQRATLQVSNLFSETVQLFWIDHSGKEVFYRELKAGDSYTQETFVTHPWRVRTKDSKVILKTITVTQTREHVTIER